MTATRTALTDQYPSRVDRDPEIIDRDHPTAWGEPGDGPLSSERLEAFDRNGYLFLDEFLDDDEVQRFTDEITRMSTREGIKDDDKTVIEPESDEVRSIFAVHSSSEVFRSLVKDPRIADIARQLLGSDVYIHQSRINYKPGFKGKEFYWHSDFETWHCEDGMPLPRAVSVSILLTDNHEYNGPLMILPGSQQRYVQTQGETPEDHFKESLRKQEIGVPSHEAMRTLSDEGGIDVTKGRAGSVVIFESNVMHGSNSNITPYPRSNVFYVYNSVDNTLVEPFAAPKPRPNYIAARDFTPVDQL